MKRSGTKVSMALMFLILAFSACNEKNSNTTSKDSNANAAKDSNAKTGREAAGLMPRSP